MDGVIYDCDNDGILNDADPDQDNDGILNMMIIYSHYLILLIITLLQLIQKLMEILHLQIVMEMG